MKWNDPSIEELIYLIRSKIDNFTLLQDKITIFTPNLFINQKLQIALCQNDISSFYFQLKTFDDLVKIILKTNINNDFLVLKELIQKEKKYQFSSKVSFNLAKKIYENIQKGNSQDISNFTDLENYINKNIHSKKTTLLNNLKSINKDELNALKKNIGQSLFFWIESDQKEIEIIVEFLKSYFDINLIFPLEKNTNKFSENKYWEFSNIQQEVLKIHNEILELVLQKSIKLNEIQIILPEEKDFFYLNTLTTFFQKNNLFKIHYSRNNQLRKNPFISNVISLLDIINSQLDYKSIFSLFSNPCFNPNFLKNSQIELWNEILQKIPIYKFLDKKHRKENKLRELKYGTWINSLKKIILNQIEQTIIHLNYQEKNEIDNLLLCIFSFLQDIVFFQNNLLSLQEKFSFFKTIINTYLNIEPRFHYQREISKELLNDNKLAKRLVLKTIEDIQKDIQSFDKKQEDLILFKELFLEKLFLNLNKINSKINIENSVSIAHLEDSLSIHYKVTFFCGFDEIHYPSKDDTLFLKKISKLEKVYFSYTGLDKNLETILYSKLIEKIDISAKWKKILDIENLYQLDNQGLNNLKKVKNLFEKLSPNWKNYHQENQFLLNEIYLKEIEKNKIKNIFFKEKKIFFQSNNLLKKQKINLSSFIKYIECPHKFEFSQNFSFKKKSKFSQKENFINALDESIFYRKFFSFIIEKEFQEKYINYFIENEIFNDINLSTQKIPWGTLEIISKEEWKKKLNKFYQLLKENLLLKKCRSNQIFDSLQFPNDTELQNFNFFYKADIVEHHLNQIHIYIFKRRNFQSLSKKSKDLISLETKILTYFLQQIYRDFNFEFSIISFKQEKIEKVENLEINQETLSNIKELFKLFLVHQTFPVIPFDYSKANSENSICSYCDLNHICFGKNTNFAKNDLYTQLINSIKKN